MTRRVLRTYATLHLRALRAFPGRAAAVVATIAVATALPVGVAVLTASIDATVENLVAPAEHVDLLVQAAAPGDLTEQHLASIQGLAGVAAAAPLVEEQVVIDGRATTLYGSNLRLNELGGDFGEVFADRASAFRDRPGLLFTGIFLGDRVAAELGVVRGDVVAVRGGDATRAQTVLDVVDGDVFNGGAFSFGLLAHVRELVGRPADTMDVMLVRVDDRTPVDAVASRVNDLVGDHGQVTSPAARAAVARQNLRGPLRLLVFLAALTAGIGAFIVAGVVLLAVDERRRQIGMLRAMGADRSAVAWGVTAEVVVLALMAVPAGVGLGAVAGRALVRRMPAALLSRFEVGVVVATPRMAVLAAGFLGVLIALAASRSVARRAAAAPAIDSLERRDPSGTVQESRRGRNAAGVAGVVALAIGLGLTLDVGPGIGGTPPGVISVLVIGGFVAATHAFRRVPSQRIQRALAGQRVSGRLAGAAIGHEPDRFWAMSTTVAMGIIVAVATSGMTADVSAELARRFGSWRDSAVVIEASPLDSPPTNRTLPASVGPAVGDVLRAEAAPGTELATIWRVPATVAGLRVEVLAVDGVSRHPLLADLDGVARRQVLGGEAVAVTSALGESLGIEDRGLIHLPTPVGVQEALVAYVVDTPALTSDGAVVLQPQLLQAWFGPVGPAAIEVAGNDASLIGPLSDRIGRLDPTIGVRRGSAVADGLGRQAALLVDVFSRLELLVMAASGAALFGLLAAATTRRRRALGLLRVVGAQASTIRSVVLIEAGAAGLVGLVLGGPVGLLLHRAGTATLSELARFDISYRVGWQALFEAAGLAAVALTLGALVPAVMAGRTQLLEALDDD